MAAGRRRITDGKLRRNLIPSGAGVLTSSALCPARRDARICECRHIRRAASKLSAKISLSLVLMCLREMQDPAICRKVTKERLSLQCQCAAFVSGVVKDAFSLRLNSERAGGVPPAEMAIAIAQRVDCAPQKSGTQKFHQRPALLGKPADRTAQDLNRESVVPVEGDSAGGSASRRARSRISAIAAQR